MAITDRAQENREYVRTLLKKNQPEFAALLEGLERELVCLRCWGTIAGHGHSYVVTAGANPASGTAGTAASVQGRWALAVMPDHRRRTMLAESQTGPLTGSVTKLTQPSEMRPHR